MDKKPASEIVKALECCSTASCISNKCHYEKLHDIPTCTTKLTKDALDLINRLQAKIDEAEDTIQFADKELKKAEAENETLRSVVKQNHLIRNNNKSPLSLLTNEIKSEAYKEFAKTAIDRVEKAKAKYQRLCKEQGEEMEEHMHIHFNGITKIINNLLKELVGEE